MRNLRCVLVDDENSSRIILKDLLFNFCKEVEVVGEASSAEEAHRVVTDKKPDLVFLDVQMPTGNGFTFLQRFKEIPFDIIFITGYDKYAINAIKFSALDYLLKPIEIKELQAAVKKASDNLEKKSSNQVRVVNLLQSVDSSVTEKKIAVHKNDSVRLIKIGEISHIESDWNYSNIITDSSEVYTSSKTLKEFEEYLSSFSFFVRIHKNCLINTRHIKEYTKHEPCIITMQNGTELEVSRRKKQEVLDALKKL